jgi:hypothetical protein
MFGKIAVVEVPFGAVTRSEAALSAYSRLSTRRGKCLFVDACYVTLKARPGVTDASLPSPASPRQTIAPKAKRVAEAPCGLDARTILPRPPFRRSPALIVMNPAGGFALLSLANPACLLHWFFPPSVIARPAGLKQSRAACIER